jgi:predicted MFS family arabinose efflux permease
VVYVQATFGLGQSETAMALAAFGGGSMIVALVLPQLLDSLPDRHVMLAGAGVLAVATLAATAIAFYGVLLLVWFVVGVGYSLAQTPSGRLLRRSSHAEDRPALFAAQFALSHACWLVTYPLAGWAGASLGLSATAMLLAIIATAGTLAAMYLWPSADPEIIEHSHDALPASHPHWKEGNPDGRHCHAHPFVIDDLHASWPNVRP